VLAALRAIAKHVDHALATPLETSVLAACELTTEPGPRSAPHAAFRNSRRTASSLMIFAKLIARRSEPDRASRRSIVTITSVVYFLRDSLAALASIPAAASASRQLPKCQRPAVTNAGGAKVLARLLPALDRFTIAAMISGLFHRFFP